MDNGFDKPLSRNEAILQNILGADNVLDKSMSREEALLKQIKELIEEGGGGGGYVLPPATSNSLGGIKIGSNFSIDENGVASVKDNTFDEYGSAGDVQNDLDEHKNDSFIHVSSEEKNTWNNKVNPVTSSGIPGIPVGTGNTRSTDTGWIPLTLKLGGNVSYAAAGFNQQIPVNNGFAYRVVNGNHVYVVGGFKLTNYTSGNSINLTVNGLPEELTPKQPIINIATGEISGWQVCNRIFRCPTNAPGVDATIQLENDSRVLQLIGINATGSNSYQFVSVAFDYFVPNSGL